MPGLIHTARQLATSKNIAPSSVRLQPGPFNRPGSVESTRTNVRERRVSVTFTAANAPRVVFHGLGFPPTGFTVMGTNRAASIYGDLPLRATSRVLVLKSDTANTVADILVR